MGWKPLAEGRLADEAAAALDAIAHDFARLPASDDPRARASLMAGDLGAAMLFGYLHRREPADELGDLVASRIESAFDGVQSNRPFFTSGYSGIGFAVEHLGFNDDEDSSADVDQALIEVFESGADALLHDWFRGASGIAVYALERLPRPGGAACLTAIMDHLARLCDRRDGVARWPTPATTSPWLRERYPDGAYSLDTAHGQLGAIVALAGACVHGVAADTARPLLDDAVEWIWRQSGDSAEARFPSFAGDPGPAPAGWCRGDLGIAAGLCAVARALDAPWTDRAVALAREVAARAPERAGIEDAAFCHGASGFVHVFNRLFQETSESIFADAARLWLERLLAMRQPGQGIGGYLFPDIDKPGHPMAPDPGLLFGSAGVGLVLLGMISDIEPAWDRAFLQSVRPPPG